MGKLNKSGDDLVAAVTRSCPEKNPSLSRPPKPASEKQSLVSKVFHFGVLQGLAPILLGYVLTTVLHSRIYPALPAPVAAVALSNGGPGAVHLRLKLAGTSPGIPEPIFTGGVSGHAMEFFIRVLPGDKATLGADLWGLSAIESKPFDLSDLDEEMDVVLSLPMLLPPDSDPIWAGLTERAHQFWKSHLIVQQNGKCVLFSDKKYPMPANSPIYYGLNPLGGSIVSDRYTGKILSVIKSP